MISRAVTDPRDGRRVALKKLPNVFQSLVSSKRVFRELKMLCFFKHDNVSGITFVASRVWSMNKYGKRQKNANGNKHENKKKSCNSANNKWSRYRVSTFSNIFVWYDIYWLYITTIIVIIRLHIIVRNFIKKWIFFGNNKLKIDLFYTFFR